MARGVEKADLLTVKFDVVCADMLRNAARFAFRNVGGTDGIKQAGLTMVNVAHDGYYRRTGFEIFGYFPLTLLDSGMLQNGLLVKRNVFYLVVELGGQDGCRFKIKRVIDRHHGPLTHEFLDQIGGLDPHAFGQFADGDDVADTDDPLDRLGYGDFGLFRRFCGFPATTQFVAPFRLKNFPPLPSFLAAVGGAAVIGPLAFFVFLAASYNFV